MDFEDTKLPIPENYDEYLKSKLQGAIDQYDPISTENIMKEAIKKIKQDYCND